MNAMQALGFYAVLMLALTVLSAGMAMAMLFFLRRKIRRERKCREESAIESIRGMGVVLR